MTETRVIKLGGSLFDLPDLAARVRRWLAEQTPGCNVIIAGGGELADAIRRMDAAHSLGEEASHWLCVQAMSVTANLLAPRLPEAPVVVFQPGDPVFQTPGLVIADVAPFLREGEAAWPGRKLARSWDVTSDSIAARIAAVLDASELVLLKSAGAAADQSLDELAAAGYVDASFPQVALEVPRVLAVNLRSDPVAARVIHDRDAHNGPGATRPT